MFDDALHRTLSSFYMDRLSDFRTRFILQIRCFLSSSANVALVIRFAKLLKMSISQDSTSSIAYILLSCTAYNYFNQIISWAFCRNYDAPLALHRCVMRQTWWWWSGLAIGTTIACELLRKKWSEQFLLTSSLAQRVRNYELESHRSCITDDRETRNHLWCCWVAHKLMLMWTR